MGTFCHLLLDLKVGSRMIFGVSPQLSMPNQLLIPPQSFQTVSSLTSMSQHGKLQLSWEFTPTSLPQFPDSGQRFRSAAESRMGALPAEPRGEGFRDEGSLTAPCRPQRRLVVAPGCQWVREGQGHQAGSHPRGRPWRRFPGRARTMLTGWRHHGSTCEGGLSI